MFDIPMNIKSASSLSDLIGQSGGLGGAPTQNPFEQQTSTPINNQPMQQQSNIPINTQPMSQQPVTQTMVQPKQRPNGGGVVLKKGQKMSLNQLVPNGLKIIDIGLGWDVGMHTTYDLDSSCFMLGDNGKVVGDDWFVFYNQPNSPDNAVSHHGDNTDGSGVGDDEVITVDLTRLNPSVKKLVFVITINDAIENGYNFSQIQNAYFRIVDKNTGKEIVRHNLTDYYDTVTSMVTCEVYSYNGEWKVNSVGNGLQKDLMGLCEFYGVNVAG